MGTTYLGSSIEISNALPATNSQAGFEALTWEAGDCALDAMPAVSRAFNAVEEPLVCQSTTYSKKGMAKYDPVSYKLSDLKGDAAQAIYEALEADIAGGAGSFKLTYNGVKTVYITAQVAKFALSDGGSGDTIQTRAVELYIQSDPVVVPAP